VWLNRATAASNASSSYGDTAAAKALNASNVSNECRGKRDALVGDVGERGTARLFDARLFDARLFDARLFDARLFDARRTRLLPSCRLEDAVGRDLVFCTRLCMLLLLGAFALLVDDQVNCS